MSCPTIVQVTNISPQSSKQQMTELFSYLGDIKDIRLFPEDDQKSVPSKVCFVDFEDESSVSTALHLTNTIFIDRALVISRSRYPAIPGEEDAMTLAAPAVAIAANQTKTVGHTAPLLPTPPSMAALPLAVPNSTGGGLMGSAPAVVTGNTVSNMHLTPPTLPNQPLISMMGTVVPTAPPLTGNVDPTKIEEIRRTVYVGNLNSSLTADQVLNFFLPCGEIRYVRMAGDETQPTRFVFVEFARPESVPIALQYNGAMFGDRPIKVNHSKNAIVKPQGPSAQETQREVDEAMKKVKEATMAISATLNPEPDTKKQSRSRSHSRSRSRSKSRERRRRRSRSDSRERHRGRRSHSRSPYRNWRGNRRDYSRSPHRHFRSRSRSPRRRSRSPVRRRSRTPIRRRSRTPPRRSPPRRHSRSPRRGSGRYRSRSPPLRRHRWIPRSRSRSWSPREGRKRRRIPSRSPSPVKRSSKKERRRHSRSKSPFEEYGPSLSQDDHASSSNSRSKKKKHRRHRHKDLSPSSPSGVSPPPISSPSHKKKESYDDDDKSSVCSRKSRESVRSGMSREYSGSPSREGKLDTKEETHRSSSVSPNSEREKATSVSPSSEKEKAGSDSSYD